MSLKFLRQTSSATRHSKRSESPLRIKLDLMVQTKKEKVTCREISSRRSCVSHSKVLENQENINTQLCQQYLGEGIVCPRNFEK